MNVILEIMDKTQSKILSSFNIIISISNVYQDFENNIVKYTKLIRIIQSSNYK